MPSLDTEISLKGLKEKSKQTAIPTKTTINLVTGDGIANNKFFRIVCAIAVIILVAIIARFAVIGPLSDAMKAQSELDSAKQELAALQEANGDYDQIAQDYSRYIVSDMSNSELVMADRDETIELIKSQIVNLGTLKSIQLKENTLTAVVEDITMQNASSAAESIRSQELVEHVTFSLANDTVDGSASTSNTATSSVTFQITLKDAVDVTETEDVQDSIAGDPDAVAEAALGVDL